MANKTEFCEISGQEDNLARYTQILGNFLTGKFRCILFSVQNLGNFRSDGWHFGNSTVFGFSSENFPRKFLFHFWNFDLIDSTFWYWFCNSIQDIHIIWNIRSITKNDQQQVRWILTCQDVQQRGNTAQKNCCLSIWDEWIFFLGKKLYILTCTNGQRTTRQVLCHLKHQKSTLRLAQGKLNLRTTSPKGKLEF